MAINLVMHASLDLNSNLIVFSCGFYEYSGVF